MIKKELRISLIQNLVYFTQSVFPLIVQVYNNEQRYFDIREFYLWMIEELTFKVYATPIIDHAYPNHYCGHFWEEVKNAFNHTEYPLEKIFSYYIKGNMFFADAEIKVRISNDGRQLIFDYYGHVSVLNNNTVHQRSS